MVKIIRKTTTIEEALNIFFGDGYNKTDVRPGYNITALSDGGKCAWVPMALGESPMLCPTKHLKQMTKFAEYLENRVGRDIKIQET